MEPKENREAAERAHKIVSELHEIFSENGWPIACIGITDHGEGKLSVIGTNQINMKDQFNILMSAGSQGRILIEAASAIDSAEDSITPEILEGLLGGLVRALAKDSEQDSSEAKPEASA